MKVKLVLLSAAILLAGCVTKPEVFPEGKDSYLLIMAPGYSWASTTDLRIEAHRSANAFCGKLGKRPETITEKTDRNAIQSDAHEEELKFKCVEGVVTMPASGVEPARPASGVSEASTTNPH